MRMSDGSSDVCSSDLLFVKIGFLHCAASRSHAGMAASGTVGPKLAVRRDVLRLLLDHLQPEIERLAAIFQQKHLAAIGNQNGRATGYPHRLLLIIGSLLKAPLLTTLWRGARCTLQDRKSTRLNSSH